MLMVNATTTRGNARVKRLMCLAAWSAALLVQGCATSTHSSSGASVAPENAFTGTNEVTPVALEGPGRTTVRGAEIGIEKNAPVVEGHPLTSVVVTQCNLVVAVYMTMPDGRLLRFDRNANVPAEQLVDMAYTATRSERVEVSCEGSGVSGYEAHGAV
jgi:hypothetical protein